MHSLIVMLPSVCSTLKWEFSPLFPHCHSFPHNCPPNWMITLRPPVSIGYDIFIELVEPWKCRTLLCCDRFQDGVFLFSKPHSTPWTIWRGVFPRRKCRIKMHRKNTNLANATCLIGYNQIINWNIFKKRNYSDSW